jgi:lipopolysaccharide transport system permease protein
LKSSLLHRFPYFETYNQILTSLIKSRELGWRFFIRDLRASYRRTFLGILWLFFPAAANGVIWIILHSQNVVRFSDMSQINYPVFVLTGTMMWSLFSESVALPLSRYQKIMPTMAKLHFPRESIVISSFYDILFSICLKLFILLPIIYLFGFSLGWNIISVFLIFFALAFLGLAIGLFLTPVGLLYADIGKGIPFLLPFLMYLTPVVYPLHSEGSFMKLQKLNPVVPYIEAGRSSIGLYEFSLIPELFIYVSISIFLFLLSLIILRVCFPFIIERAGS